MMYRPTLVLTVLRPYTAPFCDPLFRSVKLMLLRVQKEKRKSLKQMSAIILKVERELTGCMQEERRFFVANDEYR